MTIRLIVDGETWDVTDEGGGHYEFSWLSGKNEGYGFTSQGSHPEARYSEEELVRTIREFMSNINPQTGYLD